MLLMGSTLIIFCGIPLGIMLKYLRGVNIKNAMISP